MATEGSKKLDDEQRGHDQRQHAGDIDLAAYVDFGGRMSDAALHTNKKHEAATGQRLADKVVGLLNAEEIQDQERNKTSEKEGETGAAGSEKKEGVYQF